MTQKLKNRRKRLVVNKPVQRRIVTSITIVPILTLVGATLAVAILTGKVLDEARSAEENLPTLGPLFVSLFLFIVAAGAVVVIQALKYSHKIAGPMYRLVKSMQRIHKDGDVSFRIKLRSGDELTEIADELNHMMDWLVTHPPAGVELKTEPDPEEDENDPSSTSSQPPTVQREESREPVGASS